MFQPGYSMKTDFEKASRKGALYAEDAVVVTLGFADAAPKGTPTAFVAYLKAHKIPHDVVFKTQNTLTFATTRDRDVDAPNSVTRKMVAGFFKGKFEKAFGMEGYYQSPAKPDAKILPFHKVQRAVKKKMAA